MVDRIGAQANLPQEPGIAVAPCRDAFALHPIVDQIGPMVRGEHRYRYTAGRRGANPRHVHVLIIGNAVIDICPTPAAERHRAGPGGVGGIGLVIARGAVERGVGEQREFVVVGIFGVENARGFVPAVAGAGEGTAVDEERIAGVRNDRPHRTFEWQHADEHFAAVVAAGGNHVPHNARADADGRAARHGERQPS